MFVHRTGRSGVGEDARAAVFDQQVNSDTPRYPVDRYLVERSNKLEMVNIADDDIWNAEPALRPEDEIVLRKLHDMLQSTADDLKLLSGELSKYHEPGVQVKSLPTPLDEEFNEKVHIEELVNAKFHGYKVVDKPELTPANTRRNEVKRVVELIAKESKKHKKVTNTGIQVNQVPIFKKPFKINNLSISGTKTVQINENVNNGKNGKTERNTNQKGKVNQPTVVYEELSFEYKEPTTIEAPKKPLQVQEMPSINIRSELREQKVLNLNIEPKPSDNCENDIPKSNVAVISIQHEPIVINKTVFPTKPVGETQFQEVPIELCHKRPKRVFSKMSSCESSDIDSNINVRKIHAPHKIRSQRITKTMIKLPPRQHSENMKNKKINNSKTETTKPFKSNLEEWKKKLNAVYGCSTSSRKSSDKIEIKAKTIETKHFSNSGNKPVKNLNNLNNAEYIPYSKLTLGGVKVSEIERELSDVSIRNDITPILNKILSRENSLHIESPRDDSPKILTTSDENLLQEVLDIEKKVTKTLAEDFSDHKDSLKKNQASNDTDEQDSYVDDFEDDKSDHSTHRSKVNKLNDDLNSDKSDSDKLSDSNISSSAFKNSPKKGNIQNKTFTKKLSLSVKENVDIFEFIHNIDTQDTGTQSNDTQKISLKETQTSPINDKSNIQPIHNDLWPSIDPKGEVEKLFQLEKDFIKKLILDEYGDLLEKNLNKPSTSKDYQSNEGKNTGASQKNTQTSPARVKSVMTSPTRTKSRMTSPFALSLTLDQQTSPIREELKVDIEDVDDLGISINLSSPRFSLRLPQTSREVISNLKSHSQPKLNQTETSKIETRIMKMNAVSSSSSADGDNSSSDISSLGEIRFNLKRRLRKLKVPSISELSSSTSLSKYNSDISEAIPPLRSEGEVSLGRLNRKKQHENNKSEGETSYGCLY